jgi:hypothetical protein
VTESIERLKLLAAEGDLLAECELDRDMVCHGVVLSGWYTFGFGNVAHMIHLPVTGKRCPAVVRLMLGKESRDIHPAGFPSSAELIAAALSPLIPLPAPLSRARHCRRCVRAFVIGPDPAGRKKLLARMKRECPPILGEQY